MSGSSEPTLAMPLFLTGQVVSTPSAMEVLDRAGVSAIDFVARHVFADWSEMDIDDQVQNLLAVRDGLRVLSSYRVGDMANSPRVWVITEADRSSTCVLLPEEY